MAIAGMTELTDFIAKWSRKLPGAAYMAKVLATMLTYANYTPAEIADRIEDSIRLDANDLEEAMKDWRSVCEKMPPEVRKAGTDRM